MIPFETLTSMMLIDLIRKCDLSHSLSTYLYINKYIFWFYVICARIWMDPMREQQTILI